MSEQGREQGGSGGAGGEVEATRGMGLGSMWGVFGGRGGSKIGLPAIFEGSLFGLHQVLEHLCL